jgi:hypothetical protein
VRVAPLIVNLFGWFHFLAGNTFIVLKTVRLCLAEVKGDVIEPVNAPGDSKAADPGSAPDNIEQVWLIDGSLSFLHTHFLDSAKTQFFRQNLQKRLRWKLKKR